MEEVADRVQRFVAIATPTVRMLARGARFTRVPWVLVASTTISLTTTVAPAFARCVSSGRWSRIGSNRRAASQPIRHS